MECYKNSTADAARKQAAAREPSHLIRKLPPSSGNKCTPNEIKYTLEASVVQQRLLRRTQRATRNVPFHPLSTIRQPIRSLKISKNVNLRVKASELPRSPLTYEVEVELKNGPFLLLGHPIALEVRIKHPNGEKSAISLQAFQTLLRERTGIRACGSIESFTRSWVIQTMANLRQPFVAEYQPTVGSVLKLDDRLWSRHCVPAHLGPTFETCNLGRSYELEVRLGIQFGRNETEILEFEFPAYVSVPSFTRFTRSCIGGLGPKRDRCERQALEKA
ncbi:hypothetical protein N8T08_000403 [Aspergillus melleus]|uniref:Uncharacterized protein n=1 Tax=Aspergillus melleus TaxID=138277 RepID=A0ACC3BBS2_9EURO|nr:hypothetical protein N8T08_000403 [Aspergillus melleus]